VNPKKLAKQRQKIDSLRQRGGIKSREVVDVAKALGRKLHPRGKEPTYVSEELPHRPPLSIPGHTELNKITAQKILDQLEVDLIELEEQYEA